MFVVSAPSGAGKTSLLNVLLDAVAGMEVAVSHTTRPQRPHEQNGVNYHFTDVDIFRRMIDDDEFLEWAKVFGAEHLYGTSIQAANQVLESGRSLILEIDWQGARQIRQKAPATCSIFIFPPSLGALRERLMARGQDDDETVNKRMNAAFEEISHWEEFDYLIVNDSFDEALAELRRVVEGEVEGESEALRRENRMTELMPLIRGLLPQKMP